MAKIEKEDCAFWIGGQCNGCKEECRYSTASAELPQAPGDIRISVSKPAFWMLQQRAGGTLTEFIERPDCILFDVGPEEHAAMKELSEDMSEALVPLCALRH